MDHLSGAVGGRIVRALAVAAGLVALAVAASAQWGVGARLFASGGQEIPHLVATPVRFDGAYVDTGGFHGATVGQETWLRIPVDGCYLVGAAVEFAPRSDQQLHAVHLRWNGALIIAEQGRLFDAGGTRLPTYTSSLTVMTWGCFRADDYLEVLAQQMNVAGAPVWILRAPAAASEAWITRAGP